MTLSPIPALDAIPDDVRKLAHGYAAVYDHSRHSPKLLAAAFEDAIMADRANHTARADVAEGYVLVPKEPTMAMLKAVNKQVAISTPDGTWALALTEAADAWRVMIAASPAQGELRMSDELKPCPFCGGTPQLRTGSDFTKSNYSVFCKTCLASTPIELTEAVARAAWNRRPAQATEGLREPTPDMVSDTSGHMATWLRAFGAAVVKDGSDAQRIEGIARRLELIAAPSKIAPSEPKPEGVDETN